MGQGGMREGRKPPLAARAISKLESCVASIVNRGTPSPLGMGRQFGEEVGQLQVATLAPEASDAVASGPSAAGAGDAQGRGRQVGQRSGALAARPAHRRFRARIGIKPSACSAIENCRAARSSASADGSSAATIRRSIALCQWPFVRCSSGRPRISSPASLRVVITLPFARGKLPGTRATRSCFHELDVGDSRAARTRIYRSLSTTLPRSRLAIVSCSSRQICQFQSFSRRPLECSFSSRRRFGSPLIR